MTDRDTADMYVKLHELDHKLERMETDLQAIGRRIVWMHRFLELLALMIGLLLIKTIIDLFKEVAIP